MKSKRRHNSSSEESEDSEGSVVSSSSDSESKDSSASEHRHRKKKKRAASSESESDSDDRRRSKKRKHKKKKKKHMKRKRRSNSASYSDSDDEEHGSLSDGEVSPKKKRKKQKHKKSRSSSPSVIEIKPTERRLHSVVKERRRPSEEEVHPTRTYYQKDYRSNSPRDNFERQREHEVQRFYRGSSKERYIQQQYHSHYDNRHGERFGPFQQEVEFINRYTQKLNLPFSDNFQREQKVLHNKRNPRYDNHRPPPPEEDYHRRPREESYQSKEQRGYNRPYHYDERGPKRNFDDDRDYRDKERRGPPEQNRFRDKEYPERRERYREDPFPADRGRDSGREKPPRVERPPPLIKPRGSDEDRYRERGRRPEPREEPRDTRVSLEPRDGREVRGEPRDGREARGEPRDGRDVRGEPRDGRDARGESRDGREARGEPRDGRDVRGEPREGRDARGESRDGREARGEPRDGRDVRGEPRDGRDARGEPRDGKEAKGEPRDGRDARGETREGRDARGESRDEREARGELRDGKGSRGESRDGRDGREARGEHRDGREARDVRNEREPNDERTERLRQRRPPPRTDKPDSRRDKKSRFADAEGDKEYIWGKTEVKNENTKDGEKEKPNFGLSGKLTADANTVNGVVIKYTEPDDAKQPKRRWRFYPFKGDKALPILYIHRQSAFLIGRDKKVADIPLEHPSISKQHAALQYRATPFARPDGSTGRRVRPYVIDLDSANGTFVNNKKIEPRRYVELLEKDVVKFGFSAREYVLLHENSKDEAQDDDNQDTPTTSVVTTDQIKHEKRIKQEVAEDGD